MTLLHELTESLSAVPLDAPAELRQHAAVLLCDQLVLVGSETAPDEMAAAAVDERAAVRAGLGSATDRDDVHWGELVHPGAIVWSTAIELAIAEGASGRQLLRAASIGYETMVRLGSLFPLDTRAPFHLTAAVGPAAAAATASAILSADGRVSADAIGHAFSVAGGSSGALIERSGTRRFHRSHAVRTGIAAARAAGTGLTATTRDLERAGGMLAVAGAAAAERLIVDTRALPQTSVRVFPTSGWNQAAYEATRDAAAASRGVIEEITVRVAPSVAARSVPRTDHATDPWNSLEATAARAAAAGARDDRPIAVLVELVRVEESDSSGASAHVVTAAGVGDAAVEVPLGHPTRPASVEELAATWGLAVPEAESRLSTLRAALESDAPFTP